MPAAAQIRKPTTRSRWNAGTVSMYGGVDIVDCRRRSEMMGRKETTAPPAPSPFMGDFIIRIYLFPGKRTQGSVRGVNIVVLCLALVTLTRKFCRA